MSNTADFLFEIGTEELPPKALQQLESALADGIHQGLTSAGLQYTNIKPFATPRRLAVLVENLQRTQPPQQIEKRGPSLSVAFDQDGNPTRAAIAFADGCGMTHEQLERLETEKGSWLVYRTKLAGQSAQDLLPSIVTEALESLPIQKRMRWGNLNTEFVRPVHWLVMLFGEEVVKCRILGMDAGRLTQGHRFHAPLPFDVSSPSAYAQLLLEKGRVIADFGERRRQVKDLVSRAASELGGQAIVDPAILDEVTALVEWPVPIAGKFDAEFLRLPEEVLISTLQDHQRYFPVRGKDGELLPNFIGMSNLESRDPSQVRRGNERVIMPRLSDGAFFWDQDRKSPLHARVEQLKSVVFQRDLGSVFDKSKRVAELAGELAHTLRAESGEVRRAARLAKTDLLTDMVGEFPELQGRMGYYYALEDGESEAVATAIEEQYLPRNAGDRLPDSAAGCALALADRFDTVTGIVALGKKPTGNKDPFGLRRAALGVLRILIEKQIDLDIVATLKMSVAMQPVEIQGREALLDYLYEFFIDRLRTYYLEGLAPDITAGEVTPEMFEAVRAKAPSSPLDFHQRLSAVRTFMNLDEAESLAAANKRIANILRSAKEEHPSNVDAGLFEAPEEQRLYDAVSGIAEAHAKGIELRDYTNVLTRLANLRKPVDAFFNGVMVMTDDTDRRRNRLAQLTHLRGLFLDVADLSCIPPN
jgi:glycyl-tRNA synthetase beta chain